MNRAPSPSPPPPPWKGYPPRHREGGTHRRGRGGRTRWARGEDRDGDVVVPRIIHDDAAAPFSLGRLSLDEGTSASDSSPSPSSSSSPEDTTRGAGTISRSFSDLLAFADDNEAELELVDPVRRRSDTPLAASPSTSSKMYLRSIQYRLERKKSRSGGGTATRNEEREAVNLHEPPSSIMTQSVEERKTTTASTSTLATSSLYPSANDWTALRRERRFLERSYPLHRENNAAEQRRSKKRNAKTESKFLRLSRKAEKCAHGRYEDGAHGPAVEETATILPTSSTDSRVATGSMTKAKENHAPRSSRRDKHGNNSATQGTTTPPPSRPLSLPPRPMGSSESRQVARTPSDMAQPTSYALQRSRSASPRSHNVSSSRWTCPLTAMPLSAASTASRVHHSRSESPSTMARVSPPPPTPPRALTDSPPVVPKPHAAVDSGSSTSSPAGVPSSGPRPPRSPAARAKSGRSHNQERPHHGTEIDPLGYDEAVAFLPRTRAVGPCLPSPSSVATNVFNMGAGAITQCIAPSLMYVDHRVAIVEGRPYESRPTAAAPAPFYLPVAPSSPRPRSCDSEPHGLSSDGPARDKNQSSPQQSPSSSLALKRASNTREELVKLKNELESKKKEKKQQQRWESAKNSPERVAVRQGDTYQARKQRELRVLHGQRACEKRVRFSKPLVTAIRHRPKTKAEDIDKLYFGEDELEELELDRANVEGDQFELALVDGDPLAGSAVDADPGQEGLRMSPSNCGRVHAGMSRRGGERDAATVAVTYKNKRVPHRLEEGGDEVPFSPSDDTSFTYYE